MAVRCPGTGKGNRMTKDKKQESEERSLIEARERRVEEARKFNLFSNVFLSVALNDKLACQYVLRILTGIPDLEVKEVRSQYRISKIESHDAVLDVLAEVSGGRLCNLEVQRSDTIDHSRRTRLYGSAVDSEYLEKGKPYQDLPDVYVIYISETDLWKAGRTVYAVEKYFKGTELKYDDGQYILYINAAADDGSEIAELMKYFKTADPDDMRHGDLSRRVHYLKREEGGYGEMCEISEKIYKEGVEEGIGQGIEKGIEQGKQETLRKTAETMDRMGMPVETIAQALEVSEETVRAWLEV